jgi:DNA-binding MarR family transcriptional regulator
MSAVDLARSSLDVGDIAQAITLIVAWGTRNDVQQDTMRRARCRLPRGHVWLLSRLASTEPTRLSDLATSLGVDQSTLTPQAKRLECDGLIAREPDPGDRRASLLRVTQAGQRLLGRLNSARRATFDALLDDLSESDRIQAAEVLDRLAERLDTSWQRYLGVARTVERL